MVSSDQNAGSQGKPLLSWSRIHPFFPRLHIFRSPFTVDRIQVADAPSQTDADFHVLKAKDGFFSSPKPRKKSEKTVKGNHLEASVSKPNFGMHPIP